MSRSQPVITDLTKADVDEFYELHGGRGEEVNLRLIGFAGRVDGRIVGFGGYGTSASGFRVAFLSLSEEGRRYPVCFHRVSLRVVEKARAAGIKELYALAGHPKSFAWLLRLGFRPKAHRGKTLYVLVF